MGRMDPWVGWTRGSDGPAVSSGCPRMDIADVADSRMSKCPRVGWTYELDGPAVWMGRWVGSA